MGKIEKRTTMFMLLLLMVISCLSVNSSVSAAYEESATAWERRAIQFQQEKASVLSERHQVTYGDEVKISHWAKDGINSATAKGFITGYNGNFYPKKTITRAEFIKLMVTVLQLEIANERMVSFVDVKEADWFYQYVNTAYKNNLASGYSKELFLPNTPITRQEMAVMLARALQLQKFAHNSEIKDFNLISPWAKADVEAVVATRLMEGDSHYFHPNHQATREMAVVVAMRAYDYTNNESSLLDKRVAQLIERAAVFMQEMTKKPVVASVGGEWTVFGLARSGENVPFQYYNSYYSNLEKTLEQKEGILHSVKYTEYSRVILALTAIGKDISNVAGYDLREPLADFNTVIIQGINGPIFALIALDSKNYDVPFVDNVEVLTTREMLIEFILNREIQGGGWALGSSPVVADPDITAMAIQSLTPYYETNPAVKEAVDRGVQWLSKVQQSDGGYLSWGAVNSESSAQVIVALTGLGINPHTDPRFVKNGRSAVDALVSFASAKGGFYHIKAGGQGNGGALPGEVDPMATDQAMYALVAYNRYINGENRLYDMTDVQIMAKLSQASNY